MFLRAYPLLKLPITSNGSRQVTKFFNSWYLQKRFKNLTLRQTWKAGRSGKGHIIFRTRTSLKIKFKTTFINYNYRYNKLGLITTFQLTPFKNRLLSLIQFSNGAVTYYITTEQQRIFSYIYFNFFKKIKKYFKNPIFSFIYNIKKLTKVSLLELTPGKGAQYCRSSGTSAKLITFNPTTHATLAQLPSGVKKFFSYYSFVALGSVALNQHKNYENTKAGYWRAFGRKPIVRGVAMNPVDHPHGGRTKSIKYPRTPWGFTTKRK